MIIKGNQARLFVTAFLPITIFLLSIVHPCSAQTADVPRQPGTERAVDQFANRIHDTTSMAADRLGPWVNTEVFLGITWLGLIAPLLILIAVGIVDGMVRTIVHRRLHKLSSDGMGLSWTALLLEALLKPLLLVLWVYGTYGALLIVLLQLQEVPTAEFLRKLAVRGTEIGGSIAIVWFAYRLAVVSDRRVAAWASTSEIRMDRLLVNMVGKTLRVVIVVIGGMVIIQNVTGAHLGALIASLGIGGIAIALAAKESVANFLGTWTIVFDKPFRIGDRVVMDKYEGVVESVGFRSTRIRTPDGYLLSIPNAKVVDSPLKSAEDKSNIHWEMDIGISYENPPEKVRRAVEILEEVLRDHQGMREGLPPRVLFNAFEDSGLNITASVWYHPPNTTEFEAWRHNICMQVVERFHNEDIHIALPTQVIRLPEAQIKQLNDWALKKGPRASERFDAKEVHDEGPHDWG